MSIAPVVKARKLTDRQVCEFCQDHEVSIHALDRLAKLVVPNYAHHVQFHSMVSQTLPRRVAVATPTATVACSRAYMQLFRIYFSVSHSMRLFIWGVEIIGICTQGLHKSTGGLRAATPWEAYQSSRQSSAS